MTNTSRRPIVPGDLHRFRFLMGSDLSPDGRHAVYALSRTDLGANTDYTDLFLVDVESGVCRQLTSADAVHVAPVFSPDGASVAFMSTRNGAPQIFVVPSEGSEVRQITSLAFGVAGRPVWSPDGSRIAFSALPPGELRNPMNPYRVRRAMWRADGVGLVDDALLEIYVVDLSGGDPRRLTDDAFINTNPVWIADGESLAYTAVFDPDSLKAVVRLRLVGLDGVVTELDDGGYVMSHAACADGRVAYIVGLPADKPLGAKGEVWVVDPATGARECRTASVVEGVGGMIQQDSPSALLTMANIVVSDDGLRAFATVQRGGEGVLYEIALSGPESCKPLVGGERVCVPVRLRGTSLLFTGLELCEPGDLYLFDLARANERRLTHLNAKLMAELELPVVQHLRYLSTDGTSVEGWYLHPVSGGPAPYPTVVGIHGGPHSGWGYAFNFDFLMFSGAGFGVLFVNQRGSTGYGDAFATAISGGHWGELDYADVMAGVDHAIELGLADADRLGVFGISGGGYLTGWVIGHTDRFKAACPENPMFNFLSGYGTGDAGPWLAAKIQGGHPHERRDVYARCSPITSAHLCKTPTLFLQHENDYRCPAEQTEQYYAILKAHGVTAEMLRFPNSGHLGSIIGPPSHRSAQNDALLDWMMRYILGKEPQ